MLLLVYNFFDLYNYKVNDVTNLKKNLIYSYYKSLKICKYSKKKLKREKILSIEDTVQLIFNVLILEQYIQIFLNNGIL